jgi:hypothetical protein
VEALIQRQLERERLRELIEDAETEHVPVDHAAVEAKRAILRGEQTGSTVHWRRQAEREALAIARDPTDRAEVAETLRYLDMPATDR